GFVRRGGIKDRLEASRYGITNCAGPWNPELASFGDFSRHAIRCEVADCADFRYPGLASFGAFSRRDTTTKDANRADFLYPGLASFGAFFHAAPRVDTSEFPKSRRRPRPSQFRRSAELALIFQKFGKLAG